MSIRTSMSSSSNVRFGNVAARIVPEDGGEYVYGVIEGLALVEDLLLEERDGELPRVVAKVSSLSGPACLESASLVRSLALAQESLEVKISQGPLKMSGRARFQIPSSDSRVVIVFTDGPRYVDK